MAKATIYVLQSTVALLQDRSFRNTMYTRSDHKIHPVNSRVSMNHVQLSLSLPAPQSPLSPRCNNLAEHFTCARLLWSIAPRVTSTVGIDLAKTPAMQSLR